MLQTRAPVPAPAPSLPAPPIDPTPFRPYRTYSRIPLTSSITNNKEGNLVDLGLALGRSFRVGWGPKGEMVMLKQGAGGLYGADGKGGSADLSVEKLRMLSVCFSRP